MAASLRREASSARLTCESLLFNDRGVVGTFLAQQVGKLISALKERDIVSGLQDGLNVWRADVGLHQLVDLLENGFRRACRSHEAKHGGEIGLWHTQFSQRRYLWLVGSTLRACGGKYLQLALLNQCIDGGERVAQHDFKVRASSICDHLAYSL